MEYEEYRSPDERFRIDGEPIKQATGLPTEACVKHCPSEFDSSGCNSSSKKMMEFGAEIAEMKTGRRKVEKKKVISKIRSRLFVFIGKLV